MNRREFLKVGGSVILGTMISPELFSSNLIKEGSMKTLQGAEHFGVTEALLRKVFAEALAKGGDFADLFFEHTTNNRLGLMDGEVNRAESEVDYGVGVRVVSQGKMGYAYTENITESELLKAARTAAQIAHSSFSKPLSWNVSELKYKNFYPVKTAWEGVSITEKIPFVRRLNEKIFALDKRVKKVQINLSDTTSQIFFINNEGVSYTDYRPMVVFGATCIMQDGERTENGRVSRSYRTGFEALSESLIDEIATDVVKRTSLLFDATRGSGGEMPVVLGAGSAGILLHEAIGHAFEADFNRKNESIFSDKLHQKVCSEDISVIDDATLPNFRGSLNVDDEGVRGEKTYIVKNGVLNSYLHDRISANFYQVAPTGNGRRESFRFYPVPRMRATYMENGKATEEEIIHEVKKGIYCDNFTNGEVNIGAGDFTFFVKSGYLIENGRLTQPIKDINIIGNGPKALADIVMVGNNLKIDDGGWTCGKEGQYVPVSQGLPSVLVKKLVVGGTN